MWITKIEVQKKHKDRYNIYIDGVFRFGLDEGVVARLGLYEKKEISEGEIKQIEDAEVNAKAFSVALIFLKVRERSKKEVYDKLKTKGYSESIIGKVLEKLERLDIVNDKRFAEMFVRDRMRLKPKGRRALQMELLQKGINREIIEEVLSDMVVGDSEIGLAKKVLEKAVRRYGDPKDFQVKQKIIRYLTSKGFSYSIIEKII